MAFLYSSWRALSLATRIKIANNFGIAKIGPTHVRDNVIESDGYKIEDVERALNIDAIQKFTGNDSTDMNVLFTALVDKIEEKVPATEIAALVNEPITFNTQTIEPMPDEKPKKRVTKKKK